MNAKRALIIAAVLLVLIGLSFAMLATLNGSIFHKIVFTHQVRDYVSQAYGAGFEVDPAVYDFKINTYICYVQSATSVDTRFSIWEGKDSLLTDDYDFVVTQKENTISRLTREMDIRVEQDFLPIYPRACTNCICAFDRETTARGASQMQDCFKLDMQLDMQNPPVPLDLTLWVECDAPSWDTLADSLRDAKETTDRLNWQVSTFSISLFCPHTEDGGKPILIESPFCASRIPWNLIEEDILVDLLVSSAT